MCRLMVSNHRTFPAKIDNGMFYYEINVTFLYKNRNMQHTH